jgi:4-amino-4-deoxy-L-arabinose transferase-like glycosyltransferase
VNSELGGTRLLRYALLIGLAVRLFILWHTSALGTEIVDEQQYRQIGLSLLAGNGFGWGPGALTSIRPPLYPALLAAVWGIFGPNNLQVVRVLQIILALGTTALVYQVAARLYDPATARYAAALSWLYPSFVFFNFLILTETLFTFLLMAFVLTAVMVVQRPRALPALICGLSLGLAALTRSVLWPVPIVFGPLLAALIRAPLRQRLILPGFLLVGYAVVVVPWAVRNTRLQEVVTIVDTMGGINLRMGNYEYTPDDRMWDAVAITGEKSWVHGFTVEPGQTPTEGRKDKWAQRQAIAYMLANPGITLRRSLIKFADFWGLEREFIAGIQSGLFAPPKWLGIIASLLIVVAYVVVILIGAAGMWLTPPRDWRCHILLLFPVALFVAAHSIIFGHSRYHLPLIPIFAIYAAQLLVRASALQIARRSVLIGATATAAVLATIWIRQIVVVDLPRITAFWHQIG